MEVRKAMAEWRGSAGRLFSCNYDYCPATISGRGTMTSNEARRAFPEHFGLSKTYNLRRRKL